MIHEDNRRRLEDFPEGKLITVKEDGILGKHYHKIKSEFFILAQGKCELKTKNVLTGEEDEEYLFCGNVHEIKPNIYHELHLEKGSILIGLCTHPYDPTDEHKL